MTKQDPSNGFKRTITKYNSRFGNYKLDDIDELYTRKPLSKFMKWRAQCYVDSHNRYWQLQDVDEAVSAVIKMNIELNNSGEYFLSFFEEYVLLEVRTKNRMKLFPRWNLPLRFCYYSKLLRI